MYRGSSPDPVVAPNRFSRFRCLRPQGLQPAVLTSLHKKQLERKRLENGVGKFWL